jgi:hypothetical protein
VIGALFVSLKDSINWRRLDAKIYTPAAKNLGNMVYSLASSKNKCQMSTEEEREDTEQRLFKGHICAS